MSYLFEDSYLPIDPVYIRLILNFILFEYFDCNFISSNPMGSLLNLSKGAFSFCLANDEAANVFALGVLFLLVSLFLLFFFGDIFIALLFGTVVVIKGDLNGFLAIHIYILVRSSFALVLLRRLFILTLAAFMSDTVADAFGVAGIAAVSKDIL